MLLSQLILSIRSGKFIIQKKEWLLSCRIRPITHGMGDGHSGKDLFDAGFFEPWSDENLDYIQITKGFDHNVSDEQLLKPIDTLIEFQ